MSLRPTLRLAAAALLLAAASSAQTTHVVTTAGNTFLPQNITIDQGDTVLWIGLQDGQAHNVAEVDCPANTSSTYNGGFYSGLQGDNETFSVTFDDVGDFCYICEPHVGFGMRGRITVLPATSVWEDLGGGAPGTLGLPLLGGEGGLTDGELTTLSLDNVVPNTQAYLILGVSTIFAPFKQGIMVPNPDVILGPLPIDGTGSLDISFSWATGLPAGISLYWQYWILDGNAPAGFAGSNGLGSTTP